MSPFQTASTFMPPFGAMPQYAALLQSAANMAAACAKKPFNGVKGFPASSSLFDGQQNQQKPQVDAIKMFQQFLAQQVSVS